MYVLHHYILWFDVTVDNPVGVQLIHCLAHLAHNGSYFSLRHRLMFFDLLE